MISLQQWACCSVRRSPRHSSAAHVALSRDAAVSVCGSNTQSRQNQRVTEPARGVATLNQAEPLLLCHCLSPSIFRPESQSRPPSLEDKSHVYTDTISRNKRSNQSHINASMKNNSDPILYVRNIILKELRSLLRTVVSDPVSDYFHCVLCSFCATRLHLCSS